MNYSEFTPTNTAATCQTCGVSYTKASCAAKFCRPCAAKRKRERDLMYHARAK